MKTADVALDSEGFINKHLYKVTILILMIFLEKSLLEVTVNKKNRPFWSTPTGWAALGLIAAASYFLLMEHTRHFFQFLPFLILLLCPLMHVFMHGSHGKHEDNEKASSEKETFQELTDKNKAYKEGYIEGIKVGRKGKQHKESDNAR